MMPPMIVSRRVAVAAVLAAVLTSGPGFRAQAPAAAQAIDVQKLGPQVGSAVPSFSLPDQSGRQQTLQSIMGPRGAVLVFFRSADW